MEHIYRLFGRLFSALLLMIVAGAWLALGSLPPLDGAAPASAFDPSAQCGRMMVLVGLDGWITLYNTPEKRAIRFQREAGTVVRVRNSTVVEGEMWYLVTLLEGSGQGWVPASVLASQEEVGPIAGNFRLCVGSARGPSFDGPCDYRPHHPSPPLSPESEAIWLRWDFAGLHVGDRVQWMLTINGERYPSPVMRWEQACAGQHLVNLMDLAPRAEAGTWEIALFVNNAPVGRTTFDLR